MKYLLRGFAALLLVVIILVSALTLTSPGLAILAQTASALASTEERPVRIEGISGLWSGNLAVQTVRVADQEGEWLSIKDIAVTWHPLRLLTGAFLSTQIDIDHIRLVREPLPEKQTAAEPSGTIPLSIDLQNIAIAKLEIGEKIAGSTAHLRLGAAISLIPKPLDVVVNLNASRTDNSAGVYDLIAIYQPEAKQTELQITLSEDNNGLLSNIFQLENTPPVWMEVTGTGPLDNWQFDAAAKVNNQPVLDIDGQLRVIDENLKLVLKGIGHPKELLPPDYRRIVGESFDLDINVERTAGGRVDVSTARLDFEKFFLAAKGRYDPDGQNQITGGFQARDESLRFSGDLIPGVKNLFPRSIAFSITGDGQNALAELHADVPIIAVGDIEANAIRAHLKAPEFDLEKFEGKWLLEATAASVTSANEALERMLSGNHVLVGEGSLNSQDFTVGGLNFSNATIAAELTANYRIAEKSWNTDFNSNIKRSALPEGAANLIRDTLVLSGSATGNDTGDLQLSDFRITGGPLNGSGNLAIANESLAGEFALDISNLNGLVEGLEAAVQSKLALAGNLKQPDIDFEFSSQKLVFNNHTGKDLNITVKGLAAPETPDLAVNLSGSLDGQPITGKTRLYTKNGQRVLEGLKIENGPNRIAGDLKFDDKFTPFGKIEINLPDLASLAAIALQEISGSITGEAIFDQNGNKPNLAVSLKSDALSREDIRIAGIDVGLTVADYLGTPQPKGYIRVRSVQSGSTNVRNLDLNLELDQAWTLFDLNTQVDDIPLAANGRIKLGDRIDLEIAAANTTVQSIKVALAEPALIQIVDSTVNLRKIPLRIGGGQVFVKGRVKDDLNVTADISGVSAKLANQFATQLSADGTVSGKVHVTGKTASPIVDFDMQLRDAATSHTRELGIARLNLAAAGKFADKRLNFHSTASGPAGLNISGGGQVTIARSTTLQLAYKGDIPFSLLARQLNQQGILLEGNARLDVQVSGNADRPDIRGNIRSSGSRLVHAESGLAIDSLAMNVAMADQQIRIASLTGALSTGGTLSSKGQIGIAPGSNFPADISLIVKDGIYTDHKTITSNFDANIKVSGALVADPLLSGTVNLKRSTITIPDRLPASIARLDVKHKNANSDVSAQAEGLKPAGRSSSSGLRLDLTIKALRKIFIKGRGVDVELGGQLRLTNTISNPRTLGAFEILRGRLSILGKRLDFTSGEMRFNGSMLPDLQLRAETQRDSYTILIDVVGPADNPQFKFSSSPALAEDEVLAQLIFGSDLSSLSPLQIVKLGQAVATLTGHGGNSSLLDKFQGLIQADDLDVKTDEETGETTVGIGKYINDNIYVGVERGAEAATGKARIDLSIGRGVKLRGEASESGESKAGIFYEKEY